MYADAHAGQYALPIRVYNVTWSSSYDNKNGDTNKTVCNNGPHGLAKKYPHYKNFPDYPYIGGAWNVKWGSEYCGTCWNLTNLKNHKTISLTVINSAKPNYYNISKEAYTKLSGGSTGGGLQAEAKQVDGKYCGHKK